VEDTLGIFNSLDIFVFPSFEENQGMVILEAAAVGLPILVRNIPAYQGWLRHGENCLKAKNFGEFEKYLKMLAEDKDLRERLGQNALKLAGENSLERLKEKTLSVYENLAEEQE
jgi:1,2-diacylglycerol-3-alpha-glucose alpha-1,2-glucosyltransferase